MKKFRYKKLSKLTHTGGDKVVRRKRNTRITLVTRDKFGRFKSLRMKNRLSLRHKSLRHKRLLRPNIPGFKDGEGVFHPFRYGEGYKPRKVGEKRVVPKSRHSYPLITKEAHAARLKKKRKADAWWKKHYGRKENIPLFMVASAGNPPAKLESMNYKIDEVRGTKIDGKNKGKYYHPFKKNQKAYAVTSGKFKGSVLITDKKV